mmetsp:Transcript_58936/g.133439  ORF Transcript_58936/g.133439 Transcript_58936/m.133439 type:complete len:200 (-) Transcript_58936:1171-1770(-)
MGMLMMKRRAFEGFGPRGRAVLEVLCEQEPEAVPVSGWPHREKMRGDGQLAGLALRVSKAAPGSGHPARGAGGRNFGWMCRPRPTTPLLRREGKEEGAGPAKERAPRRRRVRPTGRLCEGDPEARPACFLLHHEHGCLSDSRTASWEGGCIARRATPVGLEPVRRKGARSCRASAAAGGFGCRRDQRGEVVPVRVGGEG